MGTTNCILRVSPNEGMCEPKNLVSSGNEMHVFSVFSVGENISIFPCCRASREFVEDWGRRMGNSTKLMHLFLGISVMSAVNTT